MLISLNTQAICALASEKHNEAISLLSEALSLLRHSLASGAELMLTDDDDHQSHHAESFSVPVIKVIKVLEDPFLFSRAFQMQGTSSDDDYIEEAAMIMFNMSLAYHLKFDQESSQTKAISLYQRTLNLIEAPDTCSPSLAAIWLASCNNLAHIHRSRGNVAGQTQAEMAFMLGYDSISTSTTYQGGLDYAFFHQRAEQIFLSSVTVSPAA